MIFVPVLRISGVLSVSSAGLKNSRGSGKSPCWVCRRGHSTDITSWGLWPNECINLLIEANLKELLRTGWTMASDGSFLLWCTLLIIGDWRSYDKWGLLPAMMNSSNRRPWWEWLCFILYVTKDRNVWKLRKINI